jgi:UDP-N-acetylmuramoyl-tripeptide--D-alanyl-D-alanine ligase
MDKSVLMTFKELSEAVKGTLFFYGTQDERGGFSSVVTDSRNVQPGSLFVALRGSVQDGHRFVEASFNAGACAALVLQERFADRELGLADTARKTGKALIVVEDTLTALQDAAAAYLVQCPGLLKVGITGSVGKTTTKEIAAAMIGREKSVVMNPGNLNSETGLPLSVFNVRSFHEVGIFEMGMNRKGEIRELARVLKPDIALVTNIGQAHIGLLGSKEEIALEKAAIFSRFTGNEIALVPAHDEYAGILAREGGRRVILYGEGLFKELGAVHYRGLEGTGIVWEGKEVLFGLPGRHNFADAMAAAAIARQIPVSAEAVRAGLESVRPLFGRSEVISGPVTIVRDCYNANPDSVEEVLALCDSAEWPGRRIYVLGSMLELGVRSLAAHRELGRLLLSSKADMVFLYGKETRGTAEALEGGKKIRDRGSPSEEEFPYFYTDNMDVLRQSIACFVRSGDLVLLKGSRACALERLTGMLSGIGQSQEKESDHDLAGCGGERHTGHVLERAAGSATEGRY